MQYMLMIYSDEGAWERMPATEVQEVMGAFGAYTSAMREAGVLTAGDRLRPVTMATTVRIKGGKTEVLNGPFAESREQLGGYYIIDVPDLDQALTWAARCPGAAYGAVEVRPIWAM